MATAPTGYKKPNEFPYEAFIQRAIDAYFAAQGFQTATDVGGHSDLVCRNPGSGQRWVIEAKGQTAAVGLDVRTGLGQLLRAMHDPATRYGLAVLDTPPFLAQCRTISPWVRQALGLHWLLVRSDGSVHVVGPDDILP